MPLWTFETVEFEPQVRLTDWCVLEATYADSRAQLVQRFFKDLKSSGSWAEVKRYLLVARSGDRRGRGYVSGDAKKEDKRMAHLTSTPRKFASCDRIRPG